MSRKRREVLTDWQRQCLSQLRACAQLVPHILLAVGEARLDHETHILHVPLVISTSRLQRVPGGLPVEDQEEFVVAIHPEDEQPPTVYVQHARFLGHPHVLSGHFLCLYLDASREWDPAYGINDGPNGLLNRLWRWLIKAARADFDPDEALYHAVGGLPQFTRGQQLLAPIVVRELPAHTGRFASAWLTARSDWCLELHASLPREKTAEHVPVFFADRDLPVGAGDHFLAQLIARLDTTPQNLYAAARGSIFAPHITAVRKDYRRQVFPLTARNDEPPWFTSERDSQSAAMLSALAASACRKAPGSPQAMVIAVPHPRGGPRHLIVAHFGATLADRLRDLVAEKASILLDIDASQLSAAEPLTWRFVSDERVEVSRRRDVSRPVENYLGADVLIIGVGGLGSWIAEFIVRAGAARVTIVDNNIVTGGLLVRQNYIDFDVGASKADRLAKRLRAIAPSVVINSAHDLDAEEIEKAAGTVDVIIDATVNRAVGRKLDGTASDAQRKAVIAQVATDSGSGSLGLALVQGGKNRLSALSVDVATGHYVDRDPALEPYRVFWADPLPGDEFVPTRGCSLPTFHGSAADLAAVAGSLVTLIASHLADDESGTHLVSLPYSGVEPAYRYIPVSALDLAADEARN